MTETNYLFIILLSLALAMDAFAVSIALGMSGVVKKHIDRFKVATVFGIFQGLMFVLGILSLLIFTSELTQVNKYISALLLAVIGFKMIKENFTHETNKCEHKVCLELGCKNKKCLKTGQYRFLTLSLLITYGLATSIDAFAAGVSYGLIYDKLLLPTLLIFLITFILSGVGVTFGTKLKSKIGDKANLLGGLILILLAIKSLF